MKSKKLYAIIAIIALLACMMPYSATNAYSTEQALLTFFDDSVTETVSCEGYSISGTVLTITGAGTYRITGSCTNGSVIVGKGLSDVTLILDNLTLSSDFTAPIVLKKSCDVLMRLDGTTTLTDNEDASSEATNEDFEGAAVKVKSGSALTIFGDGTLNAIGNAKNGIKGAAEASLVIDGGNITVDAQNSGIAFDGSLVINAGIIDVTAQNDGIKSEPDETDTASKGTVDINGGTITVNSQGDGIQAGNNLTITNGDFTIKTLDGYKSASFNSETMSCKALKASGNTSDGEEATSTINISGGRFSINSADDAIHSDAYVTVTGGSFYIYTGDDAAHADTTLTLGSEDGYERDPFFYIYASEEGLEAGTVYTYSGKYYINASDDGINAAGGSSNGTDPGAGGGNQFNPGGMPGGPGGQMPGGPGGQMPGGQGNTGDYSLNFYGGTFFVNCLGDGLDANGALNLYGGTFTVLSQGTGGDNSPLDSDGNINISGATVFAAGTNPMNATPSTASQKYYISTTNRSANTIVNIQYNSNLLYSEKLARNINYLLYSSPSMTTNNCTVTTATSIDSCKSNAWQHNWDSGVIESSATAEQAGIIKYTCSNCGEVERQTVPKLLSVNEYIEDSNFDLDSVYISSPSTTTLQIQDGDNVNFTLTLRNDAENSSTNALSVVFAVDGRVIESRDNISLKSGQRLVLQTTANYKAVFGSHKIKAFITCNGKTQIVASRMVIND